MSEPMGLFKKLGRKTEEFKQEMQSAAEETSEQGSVIYVCRECETPHETDVEHCRACEGSRIVAVEPDG